MSDGLDSMAAGSGIHSHVVRNVREHPPKPGDAPFSTSYQGRRWARTGLWDQAEAIPGVRIWTDVGAVEARRFGAATSGLVLVYDASGRLVFQGGITPARP